MKYFIMILIALSLFSKAEARMLGTCKVSNVFAGDKQTIIDLIQCSETLGFTKKRITLSHHQSILVEERVDNMTQIIRFDNVGDVLAMKQTAELSFLFQKRLRVEFLNPSDEVPIFMSISEPIQEAPIASAPVTPNPPATPPSVPPSPPDGDDFKPVPPPPKNFFNFLLSK